MFIMGIASMPVMRRLLLISTTLIVITVGLRVANHRADDKLTPLRIQSATAGAAPGSAAVDFVHLTMKGGEENPEGPAVADSRPRLMEQDTRPLGYAEVKGRYILVGVESFAWEQGRQRGDRYLSLVILQRDEGRYQPIAAASACDTPGTGLVFGQHLPDGTPVVAVLGATRGGHAHMGSGFDVRAGEQPMQAWIDPKLNDDGNVILHVGERQPSRFCGQPEHNHDH